MALNLRCNQRAPDPIPVVITLPVTMMDAQIPSTTRSTSNQRSAVIAQSSTAYIKNQIKNAAGPGQNLCIYPRTEEGTRNFGRD